jgi:hypothetical protein
VGVDVQDGPHLAVPQDVAGDARRHSLFRHHGRAGVPQRVEPDAREPRALQERQERSLAQARRVQRGPQRGTEDQAPVLPGRGRQPDGPAGESELLVQSINAERYVLLRNGVGTEGSGMHLFPPLTMC